MLKNVREYKIMADVEDSHWWYRSLHYLVFRTFSQYSPKKNMEILDAGCGTGGLLRKFMLAGYSNATGFDLSEYAVQICVSRELNVKVANLTQLGSMGKSGQFSVVICLDALYYLTPEERIQFFSDAYNLLVPGGMLITNQPALTIFRGTHDRVLGIPYRFNRREFTILAKRAGFEVTEMFYWPRFVAPVILFIRTIQRISLKKQGSDAEVSDLRIYPNWFNTFLYTIFRFEDAIFWSKFMGSSLYAVLKKPPHSNGDSYSFDVT